MRPDATLAVCLHDGKSGNFKQRFVSNVIKVSSGGPYSHAELYLNGPSFSAHGYENFVGYKQIDYSHPDRWGAYSIELVDNTPFNQLYFNTVLCERIRRLHGKKYDYWGAIFCIQKYLNIEDKDKWFCSEAVGYVLGIRNYRLSPVKLLEALKKDDRFFIRKVGFIA